MAANVLDTISMITRDAAMVLGNQLDLAKRVNRDFDSDFGVKAAQIGQNINVRRPPRPTVRTGSIADIQPIVETYSPLTFTDPYGTDYALTSQEITFSVEDYFMKVAKPSAVALASKIESVGQALVTKFYNSVGTPGVALTGGAAGTALPAITDALAVLNENDAPNEDGNLTLLNGPRFNAKLAQSNLTYFNPGPEISKMYTSGYQGDFSSFRVFMNQLVRSHTNGTYSGSPIVAVTVPANDVSPYQTGGTTSTVSTSGWTGAPAVGDVITFGSAGTAVNAVNPQTKENLGSLQQFSVQAVVDNGGGALVLTVAPGIVTSGQFQNVSQAPAVSTAISVLGATGATTRFALAFHRDAIMLAAKELAPFSTGVGKTVVDDQTRIPIRVQQMSDIKTNQEIMRFDVMVAWATLYDQLAVRICTT